MERGYVQLKGMKLKKELQRGSYKIDINLFP